MTLDEEGIKLPPLIPPLRCFDSRWSQRSSPQTPAQRKLRQESRAPCAKPGAARAQQPGRPAGAGKQWSRRSVSSRGYFWWDPPRLLFLSAGERRGGRSARRGRAFFSATCVREVTPFSSSSCVRAPLTSAELPSPPFTLPASPGLCRTARLRRSSAGLSPGGRSLSGPSSTVGRGGWREFSGGGRTSLNFSSLFRGGGAADVGLDTCTGVCCPTRARAPTFILTKRIIHRFVCLLV